MDRHLQPARLEVRHHGERAGEIALHVAGAAAVELAVALGQRERVGVPVWPATGTTSVWPDRAMPAASLGPMVANRLAFSPSGVGTRWLAMPCCGQIVLDEADQRDVGLGAVVSKATSRASSSLADCGGLASWAPSVQAAPGVRAVEREGRDRNVELLARCVVIW